MSIGLRIANTKKGKKMEIKKNLKDKLTEFYSQMNCDCDASIGWCFSEEYEKEFIEKINSSLKKKEKKKNHIKNIIKDQIPLNTLLEQVQNILGEQDIKASWKKFTYFLDNHNKNSLFDTINQSYIENLNTIKKQSNNIKKLNILTYGSGICGLFFAHTLKQILGDLVNIIIYDNRIKSKGELKPFSRGWLTALDLSYFKSTDESVYSLIKKFTVGDHVGLPLNYLEIILFMFCKSQNINFLFDDEESSKHLLNNNYDLIVDATGGRFKYENSYNQTPQILSHEIPEFINRFGNEKILYKTKNFSLKQQGQYFYPLINKIPIEIAQFKITNLNNDDYKDLVKFLGCGNQYDGKFYLWQGLLPNEINQSILFININNKTYNTLLDLINEKTLLKEFLINNYRKIFCEKTVNIIDILKKSDNFENIFIESPFIYKPKLINYKKIVSTIDGTPIIPIGDSLFNGNAKSLNGLYKHLPMINNLSKLISKILLNTLTEYLEKKESENSEKNISYLYNQVQDILTKIWS